MPVFFLFIAWMAPAQSVDPSEKKATIVLTGISLEKALSLLSISYGVEFSYSDDVVPTQTIVDLSINDENLVSALDKLLRPFGITYKILNTRIVLRKSPVILTQTVRGVLVDQLTNAPIAGASLIIKDSNPVQGTTTDEDGKFRITSVPIGRMTILASSIGYNPASVANVLVGTGKELVLDVKLSASVTPIKEVVVTALKEDGLPGNSMAVNSSRTFSMEDTKRYAGSLGDPARMASAFAGVTGASDESNALIVRGNSPRGVLWRIEGIEMPNPNHFTTEGASSGVVSVLSPNMMGNAEFLTGAFPAQYGNALSAVFDMNLRNGNNERREHSFQAGLLGLEASTEGPFSKDHSASYLVNYRYSTLSILDKLGADLNDAGQYKDYQDLAFKINCPTGGAGALSLFGIGGKSTSNKADTELQDNNVSDVGIVGMTYRRMLNENTFLNSALSLSGTRISKYHQVTGLDAGPLALREYYSKSYTRALLSARRRITNLYFIEAGWITSWLNYDFYLRNLDPGNTAYQEIINFSERNDTFINQGFITARQYLSPAIVASYGVHFMHFALTHDHSWEPRLGLKWQISRNRSVSVSYGKHSRIENLQYYLARDHQPGGNEVQVNKDLGFTRSDHIVLAYTQILPSDHRLKIETYYQKLYNAPVQTNPSSLYASINEDTGFITDTLVNKGSGRNYGIELSLERTFKHDFYYMVNGSLYRSTFSVDNGPQRSSAYNGTYSIHFLAGKEFALLQRRSRLGINLKITETGGRRYVPVNLERSIEEKAQVSDWTTAYNDQLPHYFRTDLQLVYKVNRSRYSLEWRLDIQNLTNRHNAAYYYYDVPTESVRLKKQVGIVPLLSCRVEF